jgi:serine/threonine-protein kinase
VLLDVIHENRGGLIYILPPVLSTMLLGAVSNALDVQFIPTRIRSWWQTGIRDRLWNGRFGKWLAGKLGAPEQSRAVGGGVFRPTEAALGLAANDLFEALPTAFREGLEELPATLRALEARAAKRVLNWNWSQRSHHQDRPMPRHSSDVVRPRRRTWRRASLHSKDLRLDLLRLHGGADNLAPITTLIQSAKELSEDATRLADAQREVDEALAQPNLSASASPRPQ